jgi:hypothetical protein
MAPFLFWGLFGTARTSTAQMAETVKHQVQTQTIGVINQKSAGLTVVINEIMAFNTATVTDELGEFEDWIELYNNGPSTQDLSGWYLTDNPLNLPKWDFPAGTTLASGGYLIIWADEDSLQGPLHANFKLSSTFGETIWLLNPSLTVVDSVQFGPQQSDIGFARVPNGTGPFFSQTPTFGTNNSPTSAEPVNNSTTVSIFPNPTRDRVNIENGAGKTLDVTVFDSWGKIMLHEKVVGATGFDVESWPQGIYLVKVGDSLTKFSVAR